MKKKNIAKYFSVIFPIILILLLANCSSTNTSSNPTTNINTSLSSDEKEYVKFLKRYYTVSIELAKSLDLRDDETAIKELKSKDTWLKIRKLKKIMNSIKGKVPFSMKLNYEGLEEFIERYDVVYKMPSDMSKLSQEEEAAYYSVYGKLKREQTKPLKYFLP